MYATAYSFLECLMHETQHGTVFRTRWINEVVYYICCFTSVQEPSTNRWVHTEHHTHTSIRGADHEFQTGRPPQLWNIVLEVFRIPVVYDALVKMIRNASGTQEKNTRWRIRRKPARNTRRPMTTRQIYRQPLSGRNALPAR